MELAPIPDVAGQPWPPDGPRVHGPWSGRYRVTVEEHSPADRLFVGSGIDHPLLAVAGARRPHRLRHALRVVGYVGVLPAVLFGLGCLIGTADPARALLVFALCLSAVLVAFGLHVLVSDARIGVQAGAHVLAGAEGKVGLYDLASISLVPGGLGPELVLTGYNEETVRVPCGLLEGHPRLWALVWHGMRYSALDGARIGANTRATLRLPTPEVQPS